jgi:hypothetical protein
MRSSLLLCSLLIGCPAVVPDVPAPEEPFTDRLPALSEPDFVVPGDGLPVVPQRANNNLAVVDHDGRTYLAWRTGPNHFASAAVQMHVISSADGEAWDHEVTFDLDTDLREPQLVSWNGTLRMFFAVLGTSSLDFEPQGMKTSVKNADGSWSEPEDIFETDFIPWRIKPLDGRLYMIGYTGGANIYDDNGEPISIHWLTSDDTLRWEPVVPGHEVVLEGGGSETDFVFLDDGSLLAVVRNEAGDETGFGSKICTAPADDLGTWTCAHDPRKYDSPLLFREGPDVWLVGRRTLGNDGLYDLGGGGTLSERYYRYQIDYWDDRKRCSLWHVDPDARAVDFGLDLPSRGDTCFPDRLELGPGVHRIWNYTSPLDTDPSWVEGQGRDTLIYRIDLTF